MLETIQTGGRTRAPAQYAPAPLALLAVVMAVAAISGCDRRPSASSPSPGEATAAAIRAGEQDRFSDDMLPIAFESIVHLEDYDAPEVLGQAVDRLNQWLRNQKPQPDWKPDPLVATLPEPLAAMPVVQELGKLEFTLGTPNIDGGALQEAVWLREVSQWARGDKPGDLDRAMALFDWTVRNIQLDLTVPPAGSDIQRIMQKPGETLLLGIGTPTDRAWIFILLCRQVGLDAALLAIPDAEQRDVLRPKWVGVLCDGEVYLFEPTLGIPIPGPDGWKLDADGQLAIRPATLSQVAADDSILRQLDSDAEHRYPATAELVQQTVAMIEASPSYLTQRMKLVESRLAGEHRLVLTTSPSAQADRFRQCKQIAGAQLWTLPYQVIYQEMALGPQRQQHLFLAFLPFQAPFGDTAALGKGRLYHLKGRFTGSPNSVEYYQIARLPDKVLANPEMDDQTRSVYFQAKILASYWLGLIAAHQNNYPSAQDYLAVRTLQYAPQGPWVHGAVYNLGRVLEAAGEPERAVQVYETDDGYAGNFLRARMLRELHGIEAPPPSAEPAQTPAAQGAATESPTKEEAPAGEMPAAESAPAPAEKTESEEKPALEEGMNPSDEPAEDKAPAPGAGASEDVKPGKEEAPSTEESGGANPPSQAPPTP